MLATQLFNVHKFEAFDPSKASNQQQASSKKESVTLVAGHGSS